MGLPADRRRDRWCDRDTYGLRAPWFVAAAVRIGVVTVAALALRPALFAAAEAAAQPPRESVPVAT
jgi:hypothetical protein